MDSGRPISKSIADISLLDGAFRVRPKSVEFHVRFAESAGNIETLEGPVSYKRGDAIITGIEGEHWPVESDRFFESYEQVLTPHGQPLEGIYQKRSRVLWAYQLSHDFELSLSSGRGNLKGKPGDYVIHSVPGDAWIVAQSIFKSSYERISEIDQK